MQAALVVFVARAAPETRVADRGDPALRLGAQAYPRVGGLRKTLDRVLGGHDERDAVAISDLLLRDRCRHRDFLGRRLLHHWRSHRDPGLGAVGATDVVDQTTESLVTHVVELDGEAIGFGLSLPDLNQPLHLAYPKPTTLEALTMVKMAWHWKVRRKIDWLRVFALGVLPEYRGTGVDALLYIETAKAALRRGYKWAEMSWILENNDMINRTSELLGGKIYKTYRMYQKST